MPKILLSVNPGRVRNIFNGSKLFEFRRVVCRRPPSAPVVYAAAPEGAAAGEAAAGEAVTGDVDKVWSLAGRGAGMSHESCPACRAGKKTAAAFRLGKIAKYPGPLTLADLGPARPPRSLVCLPEPSFGRDVPSEAKKKPPGPGA
jgi:predicted transcriptional regulator